MARLFVSESIIIHKPAKKIYDLISDFYSWKSWSPWINAEPNAEVTISQGGKNYQWNGQIVGTGSMQHSEEIPNQKLEINLQFLKPYKSKALVIFELTESDKETRLTWKMKSSLPWYLFWMKKRLELFVSWDYRRGLKLLKDLAELGKIDSNLDFIGIEDLPEIHIIGKRYQSTVDDFKNNIEKHFGELFQYCQINCKDSIQEIGYTLYHKFDLVKDHVDYTVGLAINNLSQELTQGYAIVKIPKSKVYSITHVGKYEHLDNAWSAVMMHQNAKKFKRQKKSPDIETYIDNPSNTPQKDIRTKISIPAL
ncbi:MAG: effector binding domain-containing protein [Flavobacteriaceae bacterium]|nr:effector binding domain-containing protein [Flavobacteriaceae bacterium]